ncbi:MAG: serine/threonine-protein kinase [Planctomycetota bacterium]|nr:serine/threonine-protein kinase [Planctomycetota bacterium]
MNPELWSRAREIFERAVEEQGETRAALLSETCAGDEELRTLVHDLLQAHEDPEMELEPPTGAQLGGLKDAWSDGPMNTPGAPDRIGAYRIVRRIGSGGMGTIYEAQQDSPDRTVALKILREGFSTERIRGRFLFEAEVLGRLQHEHIAHVLESGIHSTEGGAQLPWFALEYVEDAESITQFAKSNALSTEQRIRLFLAACAGVQHGHQKGVIHRDLKASNILVDSQGSLKVIDFGVACLVEEEGDEEVEWTMSGEVVGTLGAMSPEQLRGSRRDVDICTDVYSLGALLFELLTGEPALDLKGLSLPAAFEEAKKGRLRNLRELRPELDRELEWIVQRAMEFDRADRYPSVSEFASDLNRFLANEPVLAGPHTKTYHFKKFVSRHRWPVLGATAALLTLIGALAWISAVYQVADRERNKSVAINEFMRTTLSSADPRVEGPDTKVVDVLTRVFDTSADEFAEQPDVRASLLKMVGRIYFSLGDFAVSRKHLEEAVRIRRSMGKPDGPELFNTLRMIALDLYWEGDQQERAVAVAREAYEGLKQQKPDDEFDFLVAQNILGLALSEANQDEEAEKHLRESYEAAIQAWGVDSGDTVSLGSRLGQFLLLTGQLEEAELLARRGFEVHTKVSGSDHPDTLAAGNNLAGILLNLGRAAEGLELMEEVHSTTREILGPARYQTQRQAIVLGNVMMGAQDYKAAREHFRSAVAECMEHFGELHELTLQARLGLGTAAYYDSDMVVAERELRRGIAAQEQTVGREDENTISTRNNLGMMLQAAGQLTEAEVLLRDNLEIRRRKHGSETPGTLGAIHNLGYLLMMDNRLEEAGPLILEALQGRRKVLSSEHPATLYSSMNAARWNLLNKNYAEAIKLWQEVVDGGPKVLGEDSPYIKQCKDNIVSTRKVMEEE